MNRKKALSALLSIALLAGIITTANAAPVSFDDVPATHWACEAIAACVSKGIVSGMGDNKYMPDNNLTRAQFITMLVNAFYKDEEAAYYEANADKISAYYDNDPQWWGHYAYFFAEKALTKRTVGSIASIESMNNPIPRYDMAQITANILEDKNFTISAEDKAAAQGRITDWNSVPDMYRDGVATAFSVGVLSGFEDGSFGGSSGLTRAQGCVVMTKLDDLLQNGPSTPSTPGTPVEPEPPQPPASTGEISVTLNSTNRGYLIGDNGFETGYLNNGKPITEENILELLAEAEKIWPTGMKWDESISTTYYYGTPGTIVWNALTTKYNTSTQYGCGGFTAMISDYLFGKTNNPAHRVYNLNDIRPGDIVVMLNNGKAYHVEIAASSVIQSGDFAGRVWTAGGNVSDKVSWPDYTYGVPWSEFLDQYFTPTVTWEVWSRYPD